MDGANVEMATHGDNYEILAQIYTILHDKIGQKSIAMKKVLQNDYDINYSVPSSQCSLPNIVGRTALDFALDKHELEVFKMFIRHGADFTNKNQDGTTILHRIIEESYAKNSSCYELKGKLEHPFVQSVLSAHVKFKKVANPHNQDGISHLHIACMFNHVEAVRFFLTQGVCVNQAISQDSKILPGYSPLHVAARYSARETMKLLLEHGADANLRDARGVCPLFLLIERNMEILDWKNLKRIKLCDHFKNELLNNEQMIRLLHEEIKNSEIGLSRCQAACTLRDTRMLEQVMSEGIVNLSDSIGENSSIWPGYTALHFAAIFNVDAVKLLVANGADITIEDANGVTPFDLCSQRYSLNVLHSIIAVVPKLNGITFSNTNVKLADLILAMLEEVTLRSFLQEIGGNVNMSLPVDSPVWPGYTILHIAVVLSERLHAEKNLHDDTDYIFDNEKCLAYEYYERAVYFEEIELCLAMGADVTITNRSNSTPLHLAFRLQNRQIIKLLLKYHYRLVNIVDNDNLSHLHIACVVGQIDLVEKLLKAGADANQPTMSNIIYQYSSAHEDKPDVIYINPGWTCLHIAVATLNKDAVDVLVRRGADLLAKDSFGMTALHQYILSGCRYVRYKRLSTKSYDDRVTDFGLSHLHVVCLVGDFEAVKDLINHGADIEAKINYSLVRSNPALTRLATYDGYTPLHLAFKGYHLDVIKLLLQRGANLLSESTSGSIPFYDVLKNSVYMANDYEYEMCKSVFALKLCSDKTIRDKIEQNSGITELHIACLALRTERVSQLLKNGADPNAQVHADSLIWPGFAPLHILMSLRFIYEYIDEFLSAHEIMEVIGKLLLKYGACVTLKDAEGNTPIHRAVEFFWSTPKFRVDSLHLMWWILDGHRDFNVNPVDARGISHFDVACMTDHEQVVENFLKHGVDVNRHFGHFSKHYGGFTALHSASLYKHISMVDLLVKHGANCRANDFLGNTPFHTAGMYCRLGNNGSRSYNKIIDILLKAGAEVEAKNVWNETPLGVILRMNLLTSDTISRFIETRPCRVNIFNPKNEEGLLGVTLCRLSHYLDLENYSFYKAVVNNPYMNDADELGRTVIHNVVSIKEPENEYLEINFTDEYTRIIYGFIKADFDVDCQDSKGETALHKAARFGNCSAVVGLLNNGADINILDSSNKPALYYCIKYVGSDILEAFLLHIHKLQIAGLEISPANQDLAAKVSKESFKSAMQRSSEELKTLKRHTIAKFKSHPITLYNFLSETLNYFSRMLILRDAIDELFVTKIHILRKIYPEFAGLLQMQYRNIFIRLQLIDAAKSALTFLSGFALPDLCSEKIIKSLSNRDLKLMIAATQ